MVIANEATYSGFAQLLGQMLKENNDSVRRRGKKEESELINNE